MKKIKGVFACPHCGKVSFWFIALLGFGKKEKCAFCNKTIEVRRSFQVVRIASSWILIWIVYDIFMDLALYVGSKPHQTSTFALVSATSFLVVLAILVPLSVIFYRKRDSVYERDSELNRPDEADKAAQKATQEEEEKTRAKRLSFKDKRARVFCCDLCGKQMSVKSILTAGWIRKNFECEHCAHDLEYRNEFCFKRLSLVIFLSIIVIYLAEFLRTWYNCGENAILFSLALLLAFVLCVVIGVFCAVMATQTRDDVFMPPHDESEDDGTDR